MDCHFLLQGIFSTQESDPGPPHCRQILYSLSLQESPYNAVCQLHSIKLGEKKAEKNKEEEVEEGKEGRVSKEMSHHLLRGEVPSLGG